jgi:hypothetical protein
MEVRMKALSTVGLAITVLFLSSTAGAQMVTVAQGNDVRPAFGRWYSRERFESEPRISLSFREVDRSIAGWAMLLGQHRKRAAGATLGLSFTDADWTGQRVRFSTILPEDDATIGWEFRMTSATTAVLAAITENGRPIPDELEWEMTKGYRL